MMDELFLGFLSSYEFEEGKSIRGAILVTDNQTKPLEFRVTSPIRPTNFQKTLYGKILKEHILVELITIPILDSLKRKPNIIIVRDPIFLNANSKQKIPIIRIFREDEPKYYTNIEPHPLKSLGGQFEPVFLESFSANNEDFQIIRKQLTEIFKERNLIEPFERLSIACEQVNAKKIGDNANVPSSS
jgi:hypothetical protein